MRWWKVIGVAGFVGVAATGVVIARAERRRRAYTPDQIRDRLRDRYAEAAASPPAATSPPAVASPDGTAPTVNGTVSDR